MSLTLAGFFYTCANLPIVGPSTAAVAKYLALINLIPAFPMDGGRLLRGARWGAIGKARATRIASGAGTSVTRGDAIVTQPDAPLPVAIGRMAQSGTARLLVMRGDRLVGLLTTNGVVRRQDDRGTCSLCRKGSGGSPGQPRIRPRHSSGSAPTHESRP